MKASRAKILEDIKNQIILGKRLVIGGVLVFTVAIYCFIQCAKYYASTVRATGKITQMETEKFGTNITYYPVFSFLDAKGTEHVVHTRSMNISTTWNRFYSVGDIVSVLYPPANPDNARLNNIFSVWGWALSFGTISLLLTGVGTFLWYGGLHSEALRPDYPYADQEPG